jgi:Flp pilus assembly protein TadG
MYMNIKYKKFAGRFARGNEQGQSLLETAVSLPLLLGLAFNLINVGYFWFMVLALSAAPRQGVQYSTQGGQAITSSSPSANLVSAVVYDNLTNAVHGATASNTSVQVCSRAVGLDSNGLALCTPFGPSASFPAAPADPEAPGFVLHQVDVQYTVTPIIPGTAFNVVLPSDPSFFKFHRKVAMRNLYF